MIKEYLIPIIALIIGAVFKPVGEYFLALIVFHFGDLRQRKISGKWYSRWSFNDLDKSEFNEEVVSLHQFGPFIRGTAISDRHHYKINAKINPDGYIHGTWKEIKEGADWYGSLKLRISGDGKFMKGKWIGKGYPEVRAGDWEWEKIE